MKLFKASDKPEKAFELLTENPVTKAHLITYLKHFNDMNLQHLYKHMKRGDEAGFLSIQQAYKTNDVNQRVGFLKYALKFFQGDKKDAFIIKALEEQIKALEDLMQAGTKT